MADLENQGDVDAFLAHFGVKGMKWGIRKDDKGVRPLGRTLEKSKFGKASQKNVDRYNNKQAAGGRGAIKRGATKAKSALDASSKVIDEGESKLIFLPQKFRAQAAGGTQLRVLGEAKSINSDPRFKGKDLKNNPELKKAYNKEVEKRAKVIYEDELGKARKEAISEFVNVAVYGVKGAQMNKQNARSREFEEYLKFSAPKDRIRHAEGDDQETLLTLGLVTNDLGQVIDAKPVSEDDALEQSAIAGADFLEHYGVKGMKWGVTRSRAERRESRAAASEVKVKGGPAARGSQDITVRTKAGKGVTKTQGGKRNVAVTDAVKAKAARQKAKASTTDALSNAELKAAVERMNLEQQFVRLEKNAPRRKRGRDFAKSLMDEYGEQMILGALDKK